MATQAQINLLVNTAGTGNSLRDFRQQIQQIQQAISTATDPADVARLQAALATARDAAVDFRERLSALGENRFETATRGIQSIAAGFQTAQAAANLFGVESEKVNEALLQIQSAMALTEGLGQLAEAPRILRNVAEAFGLIAPAAQAAAAGQAANATATAATTTATTAATTATNGLGLAWKALGIGLVISGLAALVTYWDDITEAIGKTTGGTDKLKQTFAGIGSAAVEVGKTILTGLAAPVKILYNLVTGDLKGAYKVIEDTAKMVTSTGDRAAAAYNSGKVEKAQEQSLEKQIKNLERSNAKLEANSMQFLQNEKKILNLKLRMEEKGSEDYIKIQDELYKKDREINNLRTKNSEEAAKKRKEIADKEIKDQAALLELRKAQGEYEAKLNKEAVDEAGKEVKRLNELTRQVDSDFEEIFKTLNMEPVISSLAGGFPNIAKIIAENQPAIQEILNNSPSIIDSLLGLKGIDTSKMSLAEKNAMVADTLGNTLSSLNETVRGFYELRLQELQQQKQDELDLFDAATERELQGVVKGSEQEKSILQRRALEREKLEREQDRKARGIQKEQALFQNRVTLLQAIANGAAATINAFNLGGPILAAFVGAAVAAQVALIVAQGEQINKIKAAKGGLLTGPSHNEGGISGTGVFSNIEVEGGEFIVNKEATRRNLPLLNAINRNSFEVNATPVSDNSSLIAETLNQALSQPIKAYVVETEIQEVRDKREFIERRTTIN